MVEFGNKMSKWALRKWIQYYINYNKLKDLLLEESPLPMITLWKYWGPFGVGPTNQSSTQNNIEEQRLGRSLLSHEEDEDDDENDDDLVIIPKEIDFQMRKNIESIFIRENDENQYYHESIQSKMAKDFRFRKELIKQILYANDFFLQSYNRLKSEFDLLQAQGMKSSPDSFPNPSSSSSTTTISHFRITTGSDLSNKNEENSHDLLEDGEGGGGGFSEHSFQSSLTQRMNSGSTIDSNFTSSSSPDHQSSSFHHKINKKKKKKKKKDKKFIQKQKLEFKSSERALVDLHLRICQLETFAIINHTCIIKIIKKHDKLLIIKNDSCDLTEHNTTTTTTTTTNNNNNNDDIESQNNIKNNENETQEEQEDDNDVLAPLSSTHLTMDDIIQPLSTNEIKEKLKLYISFSNPLFLFELKKQNEILFSKLFCDNSIELAKAELFMKRKVHSGSPLSISFGYRFGCRVGACMILLIWVLWDVVIDFAIISKSHQKDQFLKCHSEKHVQNDSNESITEIWFEKDFPIYRGMFSIVIWLWLWGGLIKVWNVLRINYLFMLELDPSITASSSETLWTAADMTIVLLFSFIIHFKVLRCDFPTWPAYGSLGIWPLIPIVFMTYKALIPWKERKQLWISIKDVLIAPLVEVTFCMNYVGDVMTSLVKPCVDISYIFCFYMSGDWLLRLGQDGYCTKPSGFYLQVITPIILLVPYWLRFLQCLRRYRDSGLRHPNLSNALKYALAMLVTLAGIFNPAFSQRNTTLTPFQIFWVISYFTSTLYAWAWDVLMDWSLLDLKANGYLRKRRMVSNPNYYYFAVIIDLILRFFWTWTLIPNGQESDFSDISGYVAPFAAIAEIFRRTMWSVFRLENEHLNNTAGYRKVTHIPFHYELALNKKRKDDDNDDDDDGGEMSTEEKDKRKQVLMEISLFIVVVLFIVFIATYSANN